MNQHNPNTKPARSFVARAIPSEHIGEYFAQWAAPGMVPRLLADHGGENSVFYSAEAAEAEARRVMFDALNSGGARTDTNKQAIYKKLTGPEFAVLMSHANVSPTWFAYIMATKPQQVIDWMTGGREVPHDAVVMLMVLAAHPAAIDTAEDATNALATDAVPRPPKIVPEGRTLSDSTIREIVEDEMSRMPSKL